MTFLPELPCLDRRLALAGFLILAIASSGQAAPGGDLPASSEQALPGDHLAARRSSPTAGTAPAPAGGLSSSAAPQQDVYLELARRAARSVTMALPPLTADPGAEEAARHVREVLAADLGWSMVFQLVPDEHLPRRTDGAPEWQAWRRTGAEALILGHVRRVGDDAYIVEFRLFEVQSGQQVIGKTYRPEPLARLRQVAHLISDEAVLYFTGIPGAASSRIAFVSDRVGRGVKEIHVMDYDGHGQQRITVDGFLSLAPAFSPLADRIAFTTYRVKGGVPDQDIAMLFRSGGAPQPVTDTPGMDTAPSWSHDGQLLAFSSSRHGNEEIYVMRPDGGDVRRLTTNSAIDTSPSFAPNGRQVAFISDRAGTPHLYLVGIDGTSPQRLQVQGSQVADPAWNPQHADLIAYTASTGGNNFEIFVYDFRSRQSIQLTRGFGRDERPTWSPDGRQIAFESTQGGRTQIYAMGIDGSRLRALTREGNNTQPSWGGRR